MKIAVGIPNLGMIHSETVGSLIRMIMTYTDVQFMPFFISNSLVYDARNHMVDFAVEQNADYLLFIDSDIVFPGHALKVLLDQNRNIVTGIYWSRSENVRKPIIYSQIKPRHIFNHKAELDHVSGQIQGCTEVKACGMGFCLIKTDVLRKLKDKFISPFEPYKGMGEDISFCYRCGKLKEKIYAIDCGLEHIGYKRYK